jgi:ubiquinone biosynthesis protein COQ9
VAVTVDDMTLDDVRAHLAAALPSDAAFDGWTMTALDATAARLGVDADVARLAFPEGAGQMIAAWFAHIDAAMLAALPPETLATMKIRDRITALVEARLAVLAPHREALRRAQTWLANPLHTKQAVRLGWRAADAMWRAAGDQSVDYNHYTKRAILGSVYTATLLVFVNDDSEDWAETLGFLARRIENVMQFEKAKARWTSTPTRHFSMARFLGRLRYPAS